MIFFKCSYLRHFCGENFEFSQHCRESGASLRKSGVFYRAAGDPGSPTSQHYRESGVSLRKSDVLYRAAGDPGWPTSQHYRKSGVFCPKSDAFYRVAGDPLDPGRGQGTGLDTNAHLAGQD